jgi:hypothetical protein
LILVTDGNFTYVSIDDHGQPQPVRRDGMIVPTVIARSATTRQFMPPQEIWIASLRSQ